MRPATKNWIISAHYDYATAEANFRTGRYIYVIFFCHLATEKMLKAIVTEITGKLPPKIHDLKRLMYLARIRRPPGHIAKFIGRLSGASVFTRYPESLEEMVAAYPKEIAQKYLSETREVLEWLEDSPKLKK